MEAVLKQGNRLSPRRFQQHPRAAGRRFLSPSSTTRTKLAGLGEAISKHFWTQFKTSKIDYNAWSYSLRTGCAACLALYISFSLNLDGCHWAFTTCYIVGAQRLQGKILAKSLARVVGTFVGAIASFVLVNAFAQHGVLFIICFAAWLSLCAICSHTRRDDWAYAWVLSGYTTAIVGIPAALAPESAFDIISSRAEDILIGILCVAGVGMIASRELVGPRVKKLIASMDKDLSDLLSICLALRATPRELARAVKKLTSNAALIEDHRFSLELEETGTGLRQANLGRFQLACLELATCAFNLEAYLASTRHLPERPQPPCLIRALNLCRHTVTELFQATRNSSDKDRYDRLDQQLTDLDTVCSLLEEQHRLGSPAALELAGLLKIRCLLAASQRYLEGRAALFSQNPPIHVPSQARMQAAFDSQAAALAAVRVFVAVGLAAAFWMATAWPAGDNCLVWAGLASCRYTITPNPARSTQATFRGMIIAVVPTYLFTFYLLPQIDGFAMLVLALLPLIVIGVGIGTSLGRAGEVGAAMLLLGSGMDPANIMQYDVVAFFNGSLATIMGIGVVCLTHAVTFPRDTGWQRRTAEHRLIQRIARALQDARMIPTAYIASVTRALDDFLRLCGDQKEEDSAQAVAAIQLFALGYEAITLKRAGEHMPTELLLYRRRLVVALTQFLQQSSVLRLSLAETLSEEIYSRSARTLTRGDLNSSYAHDIVSTLASSAVMHEGIRQQINLLTTTSKPTQQLPEVRTHA